MEESTPFLVLVTLGPANVLIAGAVISIVDAATGLSTSLAKRFLRRNGDDLILFILVVIGGFAALASLISISGHTATLDNYVNVQDFIDRLERNRRYLQQVHKANTWANIIIVAQLFSTIVCLFLAKRRSLSILLWLPLSLLANVGGIVWILIRRRSTP